MSGRVPHLPLTARLFYRESKFTLSLGIPVAGAQLAQIAMQVVDTLMAGNYSGTDLAAVAIGTSIFMPVLMLCVGTLMAVNPIVAQLVGARENRLIGKNLRQGLWLSLLLSIPAFIMLRNAMPLMHIMGLEQEVIQIANGYLHAVSWGLPAAFGFMTLRFFNEALGATRPPMFITIIGLGFNVLSNYTLIYGNWGMPELGGVGAGWATSIVFWVMFITISIFTFFRKQYRKYQLLKDVRLPEIPFLREILRIGIPNGISSAMEVTLFSVTALLMGSIGTVAVAGHQIAINIASVTFMVALGLSTAITVRVGHATGRKQPKRARFTGFSGMLLTTGFMGMMALLIIIFPEQLAGLYTDEADILSIAAQLLILAAVFQVSDGLQVSGLAALRGLKDTKIPMYVNFIAYWIIGIPLGYLLGIYLEVGPAGLWFGLIAGLTSAALMHCARFYFLSRKQMELAPQASTPPLSS